MDLLWRIPFRQLAVQSDGILFDNDLPTNRDAVENTQKRILKPRMEAEVREALIYKGKIAAIKLYMNFTNCRLRQAKEAVDRLGLEIAPGQAS